MAIAFDNSYARLPAHFFAAVRPLESPAPRLIAVNDALAAALGIDADWLRGPAGLDMLSGRAVADGSTPIAQAYAGHQFGNFQPQLGDGRAVLLGEVIDRDGRRRDIQLKGGGQTPFSRSGDGRAALGPVLREYLVSEFMAAVGVPTTRALAAVATGETIMRETPLPGSIIARVAASHIRVGTFQFFAAREDTEALRLLADHVIARHYPDAAQAENPYLALLEAVIAAQARLVAQWLTLGFIHGVMNTDNVAVSGETIDYGPCAFMDDYDPATVFSSIDRAGRYAYGNQPRIAAWNLARFAETLVPLLDPEETAGVERAQTALGGFAPAFAQAYFGRFAHKIGLPDSGEDARALIEALLKVLAENQVDFTLFFRRLGPAAASDDGSADEPVRSLFVDPTAFDGWARDWRAALAADARPAAERAAAMARVNPAFIPRNHHVEAMIVAAVTREDFAPFHRMLSVLTRPFDDQPEAADLATPPAAHERITATFCGT